MKWQTKSSVLRALDMLPSGGDNLHYFLQRNITRSLPRSIQQILKYAASHRRHIEAFRSRGIELSNGLLMSFGAGWDLFENIVFYGYGINRQIVLDIKPLARIELIDGIAAYLSENPLEGAAPRPFAPLGGDLKGGLLRHYGINYLAPTDARATTLAPGSVDMIATTNTLEHIPKDVIADIMKECRRLIAPHGVVSMTVDYSDHFAHADPSITVYNFLSIEAEKWRRHNVDRHFQNRLRHSDYVRLFQEAAFKIVTQEPIRPPDWKSLLERQTIVREFQGYEAEDLAAVSGYFMLVPG
jgi:SAM-dependent methyltransferase